MKADLAFWANLETYEIGQAAYLWHEMEPGKREWTKTRGFVIPYYKMPEKVFLIYRMLCREVDLIKIVFDETDWIISRDDLVNIAKKYGYSPKFLFPPQSLFQSSPIKGIQGATISEAERKRAALGRVWERVKEAADLAEKEISGDSMPGTKEEFFDLARRLEPDLKGMRSMGTFNNYLKESPLKFSGMRSGQWEWRELFPELYAD